MNRITVTFLFVQILFTFGSFEISVEEKDRLVNGFIDYYNKLPDQIYVCEEGYLQNAQQVEPYKYEIEVSIRVSEYRNVDAVKYLKCTATLAGADGGAVTVLTHHCIDEQPAGDRAGDIEELVEEKPVGREGPRGPVALDNEVQLNTAVTSGEQFIAVPREEPKVDCTGCSSHVDPKAKGVDELANIGIRQLNSLESQIKHTLNSVVDVERQVQVVNGVRYILVLHVNYITCPPEQDASCVVVKPCKISILEKPWLKLPNGNKYRAIISNNCTVQWQFGDNGVVVADTPAKSLTYQPPI